MREFECMLMNLNDFFAEIGRENLDFTNYVSWYYFKMWSVFVFFHAREHLTNTDSR